MTLSIFFPSVSGLNAQSHALGTVSTNIANMRTVGYKSEDTMFYTMLGSQPVVSSNHYNSYGSNADIHGVGFYDRTNVDTQGVIATTGKNYDVALNGTGNAFFVVKDGGGKDLYTRAGDFSIRSVDNIPYLINNSGMNVQGFAALPGGGFAGGMSDIKIDYPNKVPSVPTAHIGVTANVPANDVDRSAYNMTVYGPNNDGRTMNMIFTKVVGKVDTWEANFNVEDGTVAGGGFEVNFDTDGKLLSPKNFDITVNWNDGSSNVVAMDISTMTQYAGSSGLIDIANDGHPSGNFIEGYIDNDGVVKAKYSNGTTVDYAKLAIVGFVAPNNLTSISGTLFEQTKDAGEMYYLSDATKTAKSLVASQALESSTSNVEKDFANMMIIQRAYSMNAKAFTTANEMTEVVVSLKT